MIGTNTQVRTCLELNKNRYQYNHQSENQELEYCDINIQKKLEIQQNINKNKLGLLFCNIFKFLLNKKNQIYLREIDQNQQELEILKNQNSFHFFSNNETSNLDKIYKIQEDQYYKTKKQYIKNDQFQIIQFKVDNRIISPREGNLFKKDIQNSHNQQSSKYKPKSCLKATKYYFEGFTVDQIIQVLEEEKKGQQLAKKLQQQKLEKKRAEEEKQKEVKKPKCRYDYCSKLLPEGRIIKCALDMVCEDCQKCQKCQKIIGEINYKICKACRENKDGQKTVKKKKAFMRKCKSCSEQFEVTQGRGQFICISCQKKAQEKNSSSDESISSTNNTQKDNTPILLLSNKCPEPILKKCDSILSNNSNNNNNHRRLNTLETQFSEEINFQESRISEKKRQHTIKFTQSIVLQEEQLFVEIDHENFYLFSQKDYYMYIERHHCKSCPKDKMKEYGQILKRYCYQFHYESSNNADAPHSYMHLTSSQDIDRHNSDYYRKQISLKKFQPMEEEEQEVEPQEGSSESDGSVYQNQSKSNIFQNNNNKPKKQVRFNKEIYVHMMEQYNKDLNTQTEVNDVNIEYRLEWFNIMPAYKIKNDLLFNF